MAAFNLTAQLNLVGPTNVRQIVGDIRKQLGTIKGNIDLGIDPKAIRAIAQLQSQASQISSSLNNVSRSASVATGSINDLNNAASKNQLGSVAQSAAKAASAASDLGKESSRSSKDVKVLSNELAEFGRQSGLAIRRFAAFSLVSGVMYKLNSAINQALSQYIDFDRELVRVSQVTGKSVAELGSLVSEISSLATSTGVASKELIQVSSTLAQAGLTARDAEKALKALALSANAPSFDNLNDTVEGSIALMRQFGISADDLESALGSVNAVAAAFAVEASDLIAAIQRTGGVFASASRGVSEGTDALNEFIAVFTSVRATTRESAETIATGLRTIFTRIQRESTITALRELGVELRDVEGKFVGPYEAVRRLSEGLGQLDPRSQTFAAIVEELGGFRQIGKVIPLIQQFATAEAALQVAMKGGDSLAEANRQAQQALAVQLAKTREEFVALVRDFANNTAFRSFLTTTIGITKSILSLARAGRSLFPLLTLMGGFKAFSAVTQFAGGFMQGVRPSGGRGGGGDEEGIDNKALSRNMGRSVSRSIGKGLGEILSGSKTERQAESLEQIISILRSNAQAFNTDVSSLSQPITSLSSLLNDNNSLLSANTSGLNNVYAALVNLEAAISSKSFTGPTTARGGGRIYGFSKGGTVPGSGKGDKVPALLEPGEVVMSNRAVSRYGRGNLVRMNKYAGGGIIDIRDNVVQSNIIPKKQTYTFDKDSGVDFRSGSMKFSAGDKFSFQRENQDIDVSQYPNKRDPAYKKYQRTVAENKPRDRGLAFEGIVNKQFKIDFESSSSSDQFSRLDGLYGGNLAEIRSTSSRLPDSTLSRKVVSGALLSQSPAEKRASEYLKSNKLTGNNDTVDFGKVYVFQDTTNLDNISKKEGQKQRELGVDKRYSGGKIQKFMAGGEAEETTPWGDAATVPEILRLLSFDGAAKIGRVANPRELLKRKKPTEDEKSKIKAIRDEATKTYNRRIGAAKGVQTRLAGQGLKFAAVGMFGDTFPDETYDAEGTKGTRKVLITAAIMDRALAEQLDVDFGGGIESIAQQAAEKVMVGNITKGLLGGKQAEFDFDRTLAVGADDIASLKDFRDPTIVQEKLKNASLTRLGRSLVDLVKAHPEILPNMRIVTARSQSTVPLVQRWLADKGLGLSDSQFVGVGGDAQIVSESDIPALKAAQLRAGSLFVDDSGPNIMAAEASGKNIEAYQYGAQLTIPNPNAEASVKGILFEKMIQNLGGPGAIAGLGFDYPKGLGSAAKYFGIDPDIPTDAKRTIVGAGTIKDNVRTYLKAMGYAGGGMIMGKGRGKKGAKGARDVIEPISSETYLKWAQGIYDEYDKDPSLVMTTDELGIRMPPEIALANKLLTQHALQTGGAGLSVGKRFVATPEQYIDDALRPYLVPNPNNPNELGFYEDVVAKFGRAKAVSAAATKKLGKAEALKAVEARMETYTGAENAISEFKKSGVLNVSSPIMDYLIQSINNPDSLPLDSKDIGSIKKKLTKSNVDAFNALVGSNKTPVSVQGQRTKLGEVFNAILETYGSDVSDLEVDSITRAMGEKLNIGGLVQKFAFGGKADGPGFEEVRKQIMDKYPEIDFRISKRKKGRGFGYNLLGALKTDGGLLGSKGLQFEQPSNLQKLIEVSDKMATSLINPQELAVGGLADATSEMASLMGGLYGNRKSSEAAPAKKQKDFGRIGLNEDGNLISAGYYKNDQRSGYVQAYKMKDNLYYVGLSKATSGYGPRLYDVVMEAVSEKGAMLTSDRSMVSAEAQKVWQYYFKNRGDVQKTPLEPEDWTKNQSLIDPKLYGRKETWPPSTDPAWVLQSGYSKSPSLINDPNAVVRGNKKPTLSSGQMALEYFGRANGGRLGFADGGSVPALVSNGEAYVPPKLAKKIGYGTLGKMNQADKNGMGRFSSGGISVFKGPGSGTSDSIPTSLPVGSFIIREKATKALGLNRGGVVQRFADGGSPTGGKQNLYPGLDTKPFTFLEEMTIKAGNAFRSSSSIIRNTGNVFGSLDISFSSLARALDEYSSILINTGQITVDQENLMYRAYEKAAKAVSSSGDVKAMINAEKKWVAALNSAADSLRERIIQEARGPTTPSAPVASPGIELPNTRGLSDDELNSLFEAERKLKELQAKKLNIQVDPSAIEDLDRRILETTQKINDLNALGSSPMPASASSGPMPQIPTPLPSSGGPPISPPSSGPLTPPPVPPGSPSGRGPKDIYLSNLSSSKIRETVSKSKSPIKDIDASSLDLLRSTAQDAGMSITEFASGLIKARDTAIQSSLEQGQGMREAALAGQEAAIAFGKLSELRSVGQDPNDALRSLLASSSRVQTNVQERKAVLSDPAVIAAIQETNKLVAGLSEDEKLTYEAMRGLSKAQREDPAIQGIVGQLTPALEKVFESRTRQKDVVGYTIEQRQERAQTPTFAAPSIAGPTNLMEVEGVNNALSQAKTDAESYAQSLRDQANNIRKQKEVTIDQATLAGFEAKAQALEEKASEAEKAYGDLVNSTQDSVDWLDTEYQTAIDTMRIRAESAAKATQDVEKAMLQRAKEISAENPQLTAEEIGQKISIENVGIVAEAKAKQQEAQTAAGAAQSRVDTLAGTAGAGAAILAQDEAQIKAAEEAARPRREAENEARRRGTEAALRAVGPGDMEDEEYKTKFQAAQKEYTGKAAKAMGLTRTRFISKREQEAEAKRAEKEQMDKAKETEIKKETTKVEASSTENKATLLLVQALNANTLANGGSAEAIDKLNDQTNSLIASNDALQAAQIESLTNNTEDKTKTDGGDEPVPIAAFEDVNIPFLDTLDSWGDKVKTFGDTFAANSIAATGSVGKFAGLMSGAADRVNKGIQSLGNGIRAANESFVNDTGVGKFAASFGKYGAMIGGGVTTTLQYFADQEGAYDTLTGTVLQTGATIASMSTQIGILGSQFGPLGGLIGAVAGAAIGAVQSLRNYMDAQEQAAAEALENAKQDAVQKATADFALYLDSAQPSIEDFQSGLDNLVTVINAEKEQITQGKLAVETSRNQATYGGLFTRRKSEADIRKADVAAAAANVGAANISKDLVSGLVGKGFKLDEISKTLGPKVFGNLKLQIAEADAEFVREARDAAEELRNGTKSEQQYIDAIENAKNAAYERATSELKVREANEDYQKNVVAVRQRLEQQGTSFIKDVVAATPKQRVEMRKDIESATGLLSGDMTKSRQQQQEAAAKAYRETGGTVQEKTEAASRAAAEVRSRQTAQAENLLAYMNPQDQETRNLRATLLETQLTEQGLDPNQPAFKKVLDSLRAPDPELAAQENLKQATLDAAKANELQTIATQANTKALQNSGKVNASYATEGGVALNENAPAEEGRTNLVYNTGGFVAGAAAVGLVDQGLTGGKVRKKAFEVARQVPGNFGFGGKPGGGADMSIGEELTPEEKKKYGIDVEEDTTAKKSTKKPPPVPATMAEAEARASTVKPPTSGRRTKTSASAKKGGGAALVAATTFGAGLFFGGGGSAEAKPPEPETADLEASPEIVQLLSAIEANTRNCCMGGGGGGTTGTGNQIALSPEIAKEALTVAKENIQAATEPQVSYTAGEPPSPTEEPLTLAQSVRDEIVPLFTSAGYATPDDRAASINTIGSFATDAVSLAGVARQARSGNLMPGPSSKERSLGRTAERFSRAPVAETRRAVKQAGPIGAAGSLMSAYGAVQSGRAFMETGNVTDLLGAAAGTVNTVGGVDRRVGAVGDALSAGRNALRLGGLQSLQEGTVLQDTFGLGSDVAQVGLQTSPELAKLAAMRTSAVPTNVPSAAAKPISIIDQLRDPNFKFELADDLTKGPVGAADEAVKGGGYLSKITKPIGDAFSKVSQVTGRTLAPVTKIMSPVGNAMGLGAKSTGVIGAGRVAGGAVSTAVSAVTNAYEAISDPKAYDAKMRKAADPNNRTSERFIGNLNSMLGTEFDVAQGAVGNFTDALVGGLEGAVDPIGKIVEAAYVAGGAWEDTSNLITTSAKTEEMEQQSRQTRLVKDESGNMVRQQKSGSDIDAGLSADEANAVRAYAKNTREASRAKELASKTDLTSDETSELTKIKQSYGLEEGATNEDIRAEAERRSSMAQQDLAAKAKQKATGTSRTFLGSLMGSQVVDPVAQEQKMKDYLARSQDYINYDKPELFAAKEELPTPQVTSVEPKPATMKYSRAIAQQAAQKTGATGPATSGTAATQELAQALGSTPEPETLAPGTIIDQAGNKIKALGSAGSGAAITGDNEFTRSLAAFDAEIIAESTPQPQKQSEESNWFTEAKQATLGISQIEKPTIAQPTQEERMTEVPTFGLSEKEQGLVQNQEMLQMQKKKAEESGNIEEAQRIEDQIYSTSKELRSSREASVGGAGGDVMKDVNLYRQAREQARTEPLAETNNLFTNPVAEVARAQIPVPQPPPTAAGGVISNMQAAPASEAAAGLSQLFDTAAIGNSLQATFGQFVTDLQSVQLPKIPDLVTMEGKHTVEVVLNGAEVLKSIEPMIKDLIDKKLTNFKTTLNNATEGGISGM